MDKWAIAVCGGLLGLTALSITKHVIDSDKDDMHRMAYMAQHAQLFPDDYVRIVKDVAGRK